jgi:hypothetical protein
MEVFIANFLTPVVLPSETWQSNLSQQPLCGSEGILECAQGDSSCMAFSENAELV